MHNAIKEWQSQGDYLEYQGHKIFYRYAVTDKTAEQTPLLLIHGFPTASWDWYKVWDELALHYPLVTFDLIGFGLSDKPTNNLYSIFQQADITEQLMQKLGIKTCHLLSHDYGDTVAQELIARHLEQTTELGIQSVVFLNGGLFHSIHRPLLIQTLLKGPIGFVLGRLTSKKRFKASMEDIFGQQTQPSQEEIEILWELIDNNNGRAVIHKLSRYQNERKTFAARWQNALQKTTLPLRLIDGVVDSISGQHLVDHYKKVIPNPDTIELTGIGHYPQIEAPVLVLQHYFEFRANLEQR